MGLTGGGGEVGEKLHGVERNLGVGSVGARDGRSGGSAKSSGRRRRRRIALAAAAVRWLGDGERVGEHQRRVMELAAGFVGREDGWRRGLRGELGGRR